MMAFSRTFLGLLTMLDPVFGGAPMDCGTTAGFKRIFDAATIVVKATSLEPKTYCNANLSQFTVLSVVRDSGKATSTLAVGQTFRVFGTSDTPGMFPVRNDQGNVLLMLSTPNDGDRYNQKGEKCEPYPNTTFSLQDCGWAKPLKDLSPDEIGILGAQVCGASDGPCMNMQNWKQCRQLYDGGCNSILVMESCPVQFRCQRQPCCAAVPQCGAGLFESTSPCCPEEKGCSVVTMCCSSVYCRQSEGATCDHSPVAATSAAAMATCASLTFLLVMTLMG